MKERDEPLQPYPVEYRYEIHDGARDGYAPAKREIFDARAAARDWDLICGDVSSTEAAVRGVKEATMSDFPECLLIVTAEVDPAVEDEWNRWYDTVHLPDALKCPGVRRGRRYMSAGEISETVDGKTEKNARRIYTTVYELDHPGATATAEFQAMRGWYHFAPHVRSRTQVIVPAG